MCGSLLAPKTPPAVEIPTPAPTPAPVDTGSVQAMNASRDARRSRLQAQESSTLVTGGQGLTAPASTTNTRQLFGQ